jgi:hypothetical protein
MVENLGAWLLPGPDVFPWGFSRGMGVYPIGNVFQKLVPGKNPPGPEVLIKGKPPCYENFILRDVPQGKVVLTHGKLKYPNIILPPA